MNHAFTQVKKVQELREDVNKVNEYLKTGWILLKVYTKELDRPNDQTVYYVLGWISESPVVYPRDRDRNIIM